MILFLPLYSAGLDVEDEVQDERGWASKASGKWHTSTPSSLQETSLKPINNLVPSPYGEFDPLVGYSPVPNLELENSNTLALVQLNSNDGGLISKLSEQFSFSICATQADIGSMLKSIPICKGFFQSILLFTTDSTG